MHLPEIGLWNVASDCKDDHPYHLFVFCDFPHLYFDIENVYIASAF